MTLEDEWMQFRAEAHEFMHNLHKKLIEDWCAECKVTTPVGYYNDMYNGVMKIYTDKPGYLIGMKGSKVKQFEAALEQEFHKPYKVEFIEIRGSFVNINPKED